MQVLKINSYWKVYCLKTARRAAQYRSLGKTRATAKKKSFRALKHPAIDKHKKCIIGTRHELKARASPWGQELAQVSQGKHLEKLQIWNKDSTPKKSNAGK